MTTIVVWKVEESFHIDAPSPAIWLASDSRASSHGGKLTDNCAKVFELNVRCQVRKDFFAELSGPTEHRSLALAAAGNTLVAHNVIFCMQQGLNHLVGPEVPSIYEIADFAARIAARITTEVGTLERDHALTHLIIAGVDDNDELIAIHLKPALSSTAVSYRCNKIEEYPYAIGSGAGIFRSQYTEKMRQDGNSIPPQLAGQVPIQVFDEFLLEQSSDLNTGGTLQLISVGHTKTSVYTPFRWSEPAGAYVYEFFGENIGKSAVGNAHIGTSKWQLNDIHAPKP